MLLESGKVSQDNLNPLASRRGRISWISAAHTVLAILSHSCLVVLWTVPVLSQNPANASTQRKDCSSLSQSGLGVMSVSAELPVEIKCLYLVCRYRVHERCFLISLTHIAKVGFEYEQDNRYSEESSNNNGQNHQSHKSS